MAFFSENPMRVLADGCSVEVMNGALGRLRVGLSSRLEMRKAWAFNSAISAEAVAAFVAEATSDDGATACRYACGGDGDEGDNDDGDADDDR